MHGDQAIGVAGIADHQDPDVAGGVLFEGASLTDEDLAVDAEQVLAFHASLAGHAADQQCPIHAFESFVQAGGRNDSLQQRKRAVVQFHDHTSQGGQGRFNFHQMQNHGLIWAEHGPGGDPKSREYPIWPAAPVTATRIGVVFIVISMAGRLESDRPTGKR